MEFTSLRKWLTSILIPNPKSEMVPPIPMTSSRFIPNFKFLYNRDVSWLKVKISKTIQTQTFLQQL